MVEQTPAFSPAEIDAIRDRINAGIRDWPTLDDRVNPSFSDAAQPIITLARQEGFLVYDAKGTNPTVYLVGHLHDLVLRSAQKLSPTPAGSLLGELLDTKRITPQDRLLVEGILFGEAVNNAFYAENGSCESYLIGNRARFQETGVTPGGNDDKLLMARHLEYLSHATGAEQGGRHAAVPGFLHVAAEMSSLRDLRYVERILDGQCHGKTFLYIGATHLFAGVIQERLERAGLDYVALVEKNEALRVRALGTG